jgi:general secretion pathway protein M
MNNLQQKLSSNWNETLLKLKQLPPVVSFNFWYSSQNIRDQKIIKGISAFIVVCLIIVLFVQPFLAEQELYQSKLDKSITTYESLANNAHKFQGQANSQASSAPILAIVTKQAKRSNINLKRFEPDGAMRWLEDLNQKHNIQIKQINVERGDKPGRVDLRGSLYK